MTFSPWITGALMASLLLIPSAWGQSLNFGAGDNENPIEVVADNGIEWQQDNQVFLARGNARATRGDTRVDADVLRAYYREVPGRGSEIWRMDAEGSVIITAPGERATGEKGVYDVDNAIFVLSGGKGVKFATEQDTVTASRQLEYWQNKQMAVARGNATAVRGTKKLQADVLVAHFKRGKAGKTRVHRMEAFDNVKIRTKTDAVTASRGVYNVESGIATLTGSVKMVRGSNVLNGCRAQVNLNTGISRLFACPRKSGVKAPRVEGVFIPRSSRKAKTDEGGDSQ